VRNVRQRLLIGRILAVVGFVIVTLGSAIPLVAYDAGGFPSQGVQVERVATVPPIGILVVIFIAGVLLAVAKGKRSVWPIVIGIGMWPVIDLEARKPSLVPTPGAGRLIVPIGILVAAVGLLLLPSPDRGVTASNLGS